MFFKNKKKELIEGAENMARMAHKVISYRKDILPDDVVTDIELQRETLLTLIKEKDINEKAIEDAIESLHKVIEKHGGDIYPMTFLSEHIEMFLVAAILAIGIRTFFFQPFKIPTNSMYPTYAGMTHEVFHTEEEAPSAVEKIFRKVQLFTTNYNLKAKKDGDIGLAIVIDSEGRIRHPYQDIIPGRKFFVWPTKLRQYLFVIDGEPHPITVPAEFQLEKILKERFDLITKIQDALANPRSHIQNSDYGPILSLQEQVKAGDSILNFDIKTGDMLFVDRVSYHFKRPKVGDPFVFRTNNIEGLRSPKGKPDEKYYIKRLVGAEGDVLEIKEPTLFSNGKPIEGAEAFNLNATTAGEYDGYFARGWLKPGRQETIPEGYFFAMGDNSDESHDSRTWSSTPRGEQTYPPAYAGKLQGQPNNFVPEKEVVGKAVFIFYPFTERWGPAK